MEDLILTFCFSYFNGAFNNNLYKFGCRCDVEFIYGKLWLRIYMAN